LGDARFRALVQHAADIVVVVQPDGTITYVSPAVKRILGYEPEDLIGADAAMFRHPEDPGVTSGPLDDTAPDAPTPVVVRTRHADGSWRHLEVVYTDRTDDSVVDGVVVNARDITERRRAEHELQERSAQQAAVVALGERALAGASVDDILKSAATQVAKTLDVAVVNVFELVPSGEAAVLRGEHGGARGRVGTYRQALEPGSWIAFLVNRHGPVVTPDLRIERRFRVDPAAIRAGLVSGFAARLEGRDGPVGAIVAVDARPRRFTHDDIAFLQSVANVLASAIDRGRVTDEMRHRGLHDALTGLPNRTLVLDRVSHALARGRRRREQTAVLFVDIDRFKRINDTLGHQVGDQLIVEVARRLARAVRPGDTVARLGGDEFLVLCEDVDGVDDAAEVANQIAQSMIMPLTVGDHQVNLTVSTGIALGATDTDDPSTLLRDADLAMYRAKQGGRARSEVFDGAMRDEAAERLEIEEALHRAVERGELEVCYQPQIDLATGAVIGAEALLRWHHPHWGTVYPDAFIPVAEDSGLIQDIGGWVLDQACRQARELRRRCPGFVMAVNLSTRQLGQLDLVAVVQSALKRNDLPPEALNFEITESALLDDQLLGDTTMRALRELGIRLSIDDFGTGYSSLSYLTRLPVHEVKIDRGFTAGLGREPGPSAIVAAVVAMAHALGLRTTAEGVERQEQLDLLRQLGCDAGQGWLWAGPRPADDFEAWLDEHMDRTHIAV
jgi:diguanylate cyclase (GGDEF)-like protein/PAS domain S-box-containing protein